MNSLQLLVLCSVEKRGGLVWEGAAASGVRAPTAAPALLYDLALLTSTHP